MSLRNYSQKAVEISEATTGPQHLPAETQWHLPSLCRPLQLLSSPFGPDWYIKTNENEQRVQSILFRFGKLQCHKTHRQVSYTTFEDSQCGDRENVSSNGNIKMLCTSCIKTYPLFMLVQRDYRYSTPTTVLSAKRLKPGLGSLLSQSGPHTTWQCRYKNQVTFSLVSKVNREHSIPYYPR